ncbi:MAG TPA: sigma-70 family RNA polymerase sigma factor [Thermoanaerobaculia bacterium]|jgi:RNA polymerase sigma-70 factor (ECF subfamily)|nr:sigma-70 family RNA polymerase sigma factor [Thermoanaerobaculia bacterium]
MKTDAELVAGALRGSQDACRELVKRFERPVYSLILRMVQDPGAAEDLAQEVFVKAFRHLASYDPRWKLSSWLFKIAHNTTIDHLRRATPETVPLEAEEEGKGGLAAILADGTAEDPRAAAERRDLARSLERAIAHLRPEYRQAVLMFYAHGASYQDICEVTGLPLGTVKTNLHRARKELAEAMSSLGWGPRGTKAAGETGRTPAS